MARGAATLSYDPADNIVFISFSEPVELNTREEISAHFKYVTDFWREHTHGQKSYFVVDFENITINIAELEFYAQETDKAHRECAITSVRYGGNPLQRTLTRLGGMKIHRPSNLYQTREEALEVVRALRRGEITANSATGALQNK